MKRFKSIGFAMGALGLAVAGCASEDISGDFIDASVTDNGPDASGGGGDGPDAGEDNGGDPDAGPRPDGAVDDDGAPPPPPPPPEGHLLLSEVMNESPAEFVEIHNPTGSEMTLTDYYLSDSRVYPELPAGEEVSSSDWIVRFPADETLPAGETIVVAVDGTSFTTGYPGEVPDYAIENAGATPGMIVVSSSGSPSITNDGEMIALFHWDGDSDLVDDVDLVMAGVAAETSATNHLVSKTGLEVDGPDDNSTASTYEDDALPTGSEDDFTLTDIATDNESYKRIALEDGNETQDGSGNGITGDDETSEAIGTTWHGTSDVYTAPTPGEPEAALTQ